MVPKPKHHISNSFECLNCSIKERYPISSKYTLSLGYRNDYDQRMEWWVIDNTAVFCDYKDDEMYIGRIEANYVKFVSSRHVLKQSFLSKHDLINYLKYLNF
jgi:hypothetical protein